MENKYFMHRIKHDNSKQESAKWDKGIEVHDTFNSAKQSYHAYLGAYAYGNAKQVDFISCMITDIYGNTLIQETWNVPAPVAQE